jgi:arsenite methyltransferase
MSTTPLDPERLRERVRQAYGAAAATAGSGCGDGGCCGPTLYAEEERVAAGAALDASLGCGVPTAVADLREGEVVLDLGSGAGGDALISARRVGPDGRVYGLDMTDEMLALARRNAREAGVENIEFLKGLIEDVPLPDAAVDVVISNCVINLSADKRQVLREAARVLRPGGRFAVSDVIADEDMDPATRADMQQWTGCVAGALTEREFREALESAGFDEIEVRQTHRVHEHAGSAIVRARKPLPAACALDGAGMAEQGERYARLGASAARITRSPGHLEVELGPETDAELVRELVDSERGCCPFLDIEHDEQRGLLTIAARTEHDEVLGAIHGALTPR